MDKSGANRGQSALNTAGIAAVANPDPRFG